MSGCTKPALLPGSLPDMADVLDMRLLVRARACQAALGGIGAGAPLAQQVQHPPAQLFKLSCMAVNSNQTKATL